MRKILSFLMMTLFSVSMFAAEPVTVKSTFTKATKPADNQVTDLEGKVTWDIATTVGQGEPTYATGQSNSVEAIKFGSSNSIYFSKVEFSTDYFKDYNVTSVNFYVANNGKKTGTLTVKQGSVTIGTSSAEFGNAWTEMTATGTKGEGGSLTVTYEVEQAFYLSYIEVTYEAAGDPDPEPESTVKTIYCKCEQDWWKKDGAAVGAHYWKDGGEGTKWPGVRMTAVDGETDLWKIDVDLAKYEKIIFVRVNASGDIADWGAKSGNQTIPTDDKNLFTITSTSAVWGDPGVEGTWSKYDAGSTPEPPTPAEKDSIFFVNVPGWDNLRVHLWGGTAAGTTWPGVEMTKVSSDGEGAPAVARGAKLSDDGKINGYDVYKYVADKGAYKNCIFSNNGADQTDDLDWTSGSYFYDGAWYATEDAIPEPIPAAVPLEGNIWKVTAETPVRAGSHFVDEDLLKIDGVYETTIKPNTRTIAGEDFTHAIQVRTDGYPSAENLVGKEKAGSTSLVITAKENVDITLYYNRQLLNDTALENDNKDLIVFDQAAIATKVTGTFTIDAILEGRSYLNATKQLALKKGHVYTVTASGTTLQLHGIKLEDHVPAMQIAGAWDVKDEAWVVNNMTLANDKLTASYEVELAKGDYEFKVLKDGAWLTKANEGAYGLHRDWPGVAGVTDDAQNNLKLTADAAGTYTFTWTFANDSIGITFPEPEPDPKFYIVGNAEVFGGWSTFVPVYEDSYEIKDLAAGDYAFRLCMNDGEWTDDYGFEQLTVKPEGVSTDDHNNICFTLREKSDFKVTYKPASGDDEAVFTVEADFYVPVMADLFLVPNQWADGDAKIAAWVWNKEYSINAFTAFFAPKAEDNDTLVAKVFAEADSIIFVRFNKDATEPKWNGGEGYQWNQTPNDSIQWDKAVFTILPDEGYYSKGTWDVYIPEPAAKFYISGNAALVGEEHAWDAQAIKSTEDNYIFEGLQADTEYKLKVIEDGNWEGDKVYGFDALSVKAEGLSTDGDNNIVFKLAEDGNVKVTFFWEEVNKDEWILIFKLEGKFYVAPAPVLTDGFYLIGQKGWDVAALSADLLFEANPENPSEYQLTVNLVKDESIKVVRVESDVIKEWYPDGEGNDYKVDADHEGLKTIYFKPDYDSDWAEFGGFFYIEKNQGTAVDNTAVDTKATKTIRNGQLFILRDGKTYNALGTEIR